MLRNYSNTAPLLQITAAIGASDEAISVPDTSGYPAVPFTGGLDRGTPSEEFVLVTASTSTTFTIERGYDGTTAVPHAIGATFEHCVGSIDYREANEAANAPDPSIPSQFSSGMIMPTASATPPAGWLNCDGSAVSRTFYASLFNAIGTAYGVGDGSSTFNLPNSHGRVLVGTGTGFAMGASGGESTHQLSIPELPTHDHGVTDPTHSHAAVAGGDSPTHAHPHVHGENSQGAHSHAGAQAGGIYQDNGALLTHPVGSTGALASLPADRTDTAAGHTHQISEDSSPNSGSHSHGVSITGAGTGVSTQNAGSNTPHNNLQPYLVVNYIIKA